MSLPIYPKYKSADVPWVPEIPYDWASVALSRVLARAVTDGPHTTPTFVDSGVPFLSVDAIQGGRLSFEGCRYISEADHLEYSKKANPKRDDILMGKAASVGKIARVRDEAEFSIWSPLALIRVAPETCLPAFAEYVLKSSPLQAQIETKANSNTQLNIGMKDIPKLQICLPSLAEQAAITAFLDRETAKIDALINEQEKLLALLSEKRQATISHVVTRGLDPSVPMKDSGVPWLGRIPAHWSVSQSRRMFAVRSESALATDRMLTASQKYGVLYQEEFVEREGRRVVEVIKGVENLKHVEPNDFIISMRSFQGGLEWCRLGGSTSFHYVMVKPIKGVHPPYFAHLFKSQIYIQALRATTDLIRDGQELRYSNFVMVDLPWVPLDEQAQIASFLDHELEKIDILTSDCRDAIRLLGERKSALITAVVTGQIDVRGLLVDQVA